MDRNRGLDINALRQQLEDLLEDFFPTGGQRRPQGGRGPGGEQPQYLPVNLTEADGALVLTAPLPGLQPEDIDINVRGQSLTLKAQLKNPPAERPNYLRREWSFGPYQRNIEIPFPIDAERATARFMHGVVTITLPRASAARTIHVEETREASEATEGMPEAPEAPETAEAPEMAETAEIAAAPEPEETAEGVNIETQESVAPETSGTATAEPMAVQQEAEHAGREERGGRGFYMRQRGRRGRGRDNQNSPAAQPGAPAETEEAPQAEGQPSAVTPEFEQSVSEQVSAEAREAEDRAAGEVQPEPGVTEAATPSGQGEILQPDTENAPQAAVPNTTTASPETPDLSRQEGPSTAGEEAPAPAEPQPDFTRPSEPTDTHTEQTPSD